MVLSSPNIETLSGTNLENYVGAIFQNAGYYVDRDLTWTAPREDDPSKSIDILQLDVLASNFHPFGEDKILVECKGGGTFTDFFKFLGVKSFFDPHLAFFISNNPNSFDEIHRIGSENDVTVIIPHHILNTYGIPDQESKINFWFWANTLTERLINRETLKDALDVTDFSDEQREAYNEIRKLLSILKNHIWKDLDPREQCLKLEELFDQNKGFVRKILSIQNQPVVDTENAIDQNILCESAAYVILSAKIYYINSAVRCAIYSLISPDEDYLDKLNNDTFKAVVSELIDNINSASKLPVFIQFWIFLCGGMLNRQNGEVKKFAKFSGIREDDFLKYIELLRKIFTIMAPFGEIQWSLNERGSILEFNAVPNSIRGLGIEFRKSLDIDTENFLYKQQFLTRLEEI